jgi:hypothetical protein
VFVISASTTQNKWKNNHNETSALTVSPGIFPGAAPVDGKAELVAAD